MTHTHLLTADNLYFSRSGQDILQDVSLAITPQDFITIIGPNGAGKSILLKILLGCQKADSGMVRRKAGLRIGYVPQRLLPEATLPMSVERFLKLLIRTEPDFFAQIIEQTGIEALRNKPLHVLSGGEMQRVLLARALLHKPELLVLDEPAQNLDIGGQLQFYRLLERIYKEHGCAVLMVSHDLHMVMATTNQVICLFHHVCCSGHPDTVTKDPKFTALFGNDMARMMAVYHHEHDHSHNGGACNHGA